MKAITLIRVGVSVILSATILVVGCQEGAYTWEKATVSGTVSNAAGKDKSVEIKADGQPGIVVENSGKGKELVGIVGKKVEVNGKVRVSDGTKLIKVESYKQID